MTAADDGAEIGRLAALPPLDYEREREEAAGRLGCRVAILDQEVEKVRAAKAADTVPNNTPVNSSGAGHALAIPEIEPWPEPVDGAALLAALVEVVRRFVVLDAPAAVACALWIVQTHAIEAAFVSPRLAITSPEKRCGKTTLLTLLRGLVARPLATANMTAALLFRTIEAVQPTLLVDEADTFLGDTDAMRGIINAGHCRATATVLRLVADAGDGWEPRQFDVWAAMALAAIGKLPGTIEDRSIMIAMRRKRPDENLERLRLDRLDRLVPLARQAMRWAEDYHMTLSATDPEVPAALHDRAADNWRPLLAIADVAGGEWPEQARRAALVLARDGTTETDGSGVTLLADLRELFAPEPRGVLFTAEILDALHRREDRPWAEFKRGRPITPHQFAALLRPYGIPTNQTVRRGAVTAKGYRARDFADVWARYVSEKRVTQSQAAETAGFEATATVTPPDHGSGNGFVTAQPADGVTDAPSVTTAGAVTEKTADFRSCDGVTEKIPSVS